MELQFYSFLGLFFLICVAIMVHVNHQLMKGADKRLKNANDIVMKLSESCDKLAETNVHLQRHITSLEALYDDKLKESTRSREEMRDAYVKLLHKYELLEEKIISGYERMHSENFTTVQGLANRPSITNSNTELTK